MDSSSLAMLAAILVLVCLSAYFSATETAFSSLNALRLRAKADGGDRRAALTLALAADYDRLLSTILIGNNLVNITASTVGAVLFDRLLGAGYGPTVSTVVLTAVVLVFGEISPKSLAKERPERFAMASAPVLRVFLALLRPLNWLFSQWKRLLRRFLRPAEEPGVTDAELLGLVSEAEREGGLDEHESALIRSAIAFGDREAGDILTPRVAVEALPRAATAEEAAARFAETGFSRLPVYGESLDDILGVLHEKDLHAARRRGQADLTDCVSPVPFAAPGTPVGRLLRTLQREKAHMAVVVDEYGGTAGIVTLEDILEELVGEIWDEHDQVAEPFRRQPDGGWLVDCAADLSAFRARFSLRDDGICASTVSGWAAERLGRLPVTGDRFRAEGLEVTVTRADRRRPLEVRVAPAPDSAPGLSVAAEAETC